MPDPVFTPVTLAQARADATITRLVGADTLALAELVVAHIPDAVAPLVIQTRPWREGEAHPDDLPVAVHVWYHPAFAALLRDLPDRTRAHARREAVHARTGTERLRARYWEHVDAVSALTRRQRADERDALDDHTTEQRLILQELARRGEPLVPTP